MVKVGLVGEQNLHAEALVAALCEAGQVDCRLLSLKEIAGFREANYEERVFLLDFADEQGKKGMLLPKVRRLFPNCRVIYLTESADPELAAELFNRGAWGVFPKAGGLAALKKAVRAIAGGEIWADRRSSSQVIRSMVEGKRKPGKGDGEQALSKRERQILALVAAGMKNRRVAEKLNISELTVKVHLSSVFRKIGVRDRLQAALYAIHNGITPASIPLD